MKTKATSTETDLTSLVLGTNPLSTLTEAFRRYDSQGAASALVTVARSHKGEPYFGRIAETALFSLKKMQLEAGLPAARVIDDLPMSSGSGGGIGYGDYMRFLLAMREMEVVPRLRW